MNQIEFQEKEEGLDLRKIFGQYISKWPWFVLSVLLFLIVAYTYIRYSVPMYQSETILKFDKKQTDLSSALSDLDNLGIGLGNSDELKSEAAVVISRPILTRVVRNLNLNIQYFREGEIKDAEFFGAIPITAQILSYNDEKKFVSSEYVLTEIKGSQFTLWNDKDGTVKGFFNQPVKLNFGVAVLRKHFNLLPHWKYRISFTTPLEKVKELEKKIKVDLPDQKALLMNISATGAVPEKSEAILNEVTRQYNLDGLRDKNLQAQNTQEFIDRRLEVITRDLSGVENKKEDFQNQNNIVDLQAQAQLALQNTSDNTKALLEQQTQLDLINSLETEASKSTSQLMPSNLGLNPSLEQAINQYNTLVISRNKTLKQATNENPAVIEMNKELSSLKEIVRDNINEQKATVQASISQINGRISQDNRAIGRVPQQSKVYRGIERQQTLKEQLFLFLLQKREENAINLSVNVPKAKIVNPAFTKDIPVSPKKNIIFLGAILLGILFPSVIFYLIFMWDDKIYNREDIKEHSPLGVLADIPKLKSNENHLVMKNDFSELAEAFRVLVSNLKFVLPTKDTAKIVMVTSSVKGEGKTLISVNLALTLANKNGRALLIGSDIRNPQIQRYDDAQVKRKGLTEYLYDDSVEVDELIHTSDSNPYCDVIYSGSIPPNPQELLSNGRYQKLIDEMSTKYTYIIIDSAPLMLVSDTLSISNVADATLYLVRAGVTRSLMLDFVNGLVKDSKIPNVSFIVNDVSKTYGYAYNYGYGYGYSKDKQDNWFKKLLKKIN
ncbi:polysaccharide biosynthesis tyrosine autokinase [Chryseobacterium nematophagum]|uniref:non-specific protein-tyrosine kinase n=1 Tax=Chryseobacterium nematophagum TaxID=2305228 RepID=A0A3M7TED7_9FLAO|nr:tyrosine-protein kinase family protein [Chryseobacterium nematophagum]RNA61668.1 polysaccharide biosynthesis tyrosine autokinase [Chryseobacterium nematophagum]